MVAKGVLFGCMALAMSLGAATVGRAAADTGEQLYNGRCSRCHGVEGRGGEGPKLVPFQLSDQEALRLIRQPECDMPAFPESDLSDEEVQEVLTYLRTLK
jgi:mono/diheme cytochrome c family protein